MRKLNWIVILFLSLGKLTNAQQQESIDSLETELKIELSKSSKDSVKIAKLYAFLINDLILFNSEAIPKPYFYKGISYCKQDSCNYDFYNVMIRHYMSNNQSDSILKYSKELLSKVNSMPRAVSYAYLGIGAAQSIEGDVPSSVSSYKKALIEAKKTNDKDWILAVEMNLAAGYYSTGKLDSALAIYKKAVNQFKKLPTGAEDFLTTMYGNIGSIYFKFNTDSSIHYLKLSKYMAMEMGKSTRIALATNNLGMAYVSLDKTTLAEKELLHALALYKELNNQIPLPKLYSRIGAIKAKHGEFQLAIQYLDSSNQVHKNLRSESRTKAIAEAETKFGLVEEALKNQLLKEEETKAKATIASQRILVLGTILILLLVAVIALVQHRNKKIVQKLNNDLKLKNERLDNLVNEKDNLMGILVHDVRSPMASITSAITIVESDKNNSLSEFSKDIFSEIVKTTHHGLAMINDIWQVYSIESSLNSIKKEPLRLDELFIRLKDEFKTTANSRNINIKIDTKEILLNSNSTYLEAVFRNLVSNALKFSPTNSNVWIEVSNVNSFTIVKLRDQGPGFSLEDRKKMHYKFQPLSAKPLHGEKSSGLGLYLVKLICDQLNIIIELNQAYKHGAEFVLTFPE